MNKIKWPDKQEDSILKGGDLIKRNGNILMVIQKDDKYSVINLENGQMYFETFYEKDRLTAMLRVESYQLLQDREIIIK